MLSAKRILEEFSYDAVNKRMLYQFQDKKNIQAVLHALWKQQDDLTKAGQAFFDKLDLDKAEGYELDMIGTIIGQSRIIEDVEKDHYFGFKEQWNARTFEEGKYRDSTQEFGEAGVVWDDDKYRDLIKARILKRASVCSFDDTIRSVRYLFHDENATVKNAGNANVSIYLSSTPTEKDFITLKRLDLLVIAAGVGIKAVYVYPNNHFGFKEQLNAKGLDVGTFTEPFMMDNTFGFAQEESEKNKPICFGFYEQDGAGGFGTPISQS